MSSLEQAAKLLDRPNLRPDPSRGDWRPEQVSELTRLFDIALGDLDLDRVAAENPSELAPLAEHAAAKSHRRSVLPGAAGAAVQDNWIRTSELHLSNQASNTDSEYARPSCSQTSASCVF